MSEREKWSPAARLLTASVVFLLLTIALCSAGTPFMGTGTPLQDSAQAAGFITLLLAIVTFIVGIIVLLITLFRGK